MSKQRPDPDKMANELSGASAFFKRTAAPLSDQAPASPVPPAPTAPAARSSAPQPEPVRPVRDGRPARRIMIRHPFELYADQLERLRELADEQRRRGETGSMSKMVREAIDRLIDEHDGA